MKPQRKAFLRSARAVSFGGVIVAICVAALIFHRHESRVLGQVQEGKRYTTELVVQAGHSDTIKAVAFSPDGKLLASGGFDNTIKLWHVETARELRTLYGHSFRIHSVAFSPDGRIIASAGVGREI